MPVVRPGWEQRSIQFPKDLIELAENFGKRKWPPKRFSEVVLEALGNMLGYDYNPDGDSNDASPSSSNGARPDERK